MQLNISAHMTLIKQIANKIFTQTGYISLHL
jgi:hypothetical protein